MNATAKYPAARASWTDIQACFHDVQPPYREGDIVRFNLVYQRVYPRLSPEEKLQAEAFIDQLLEGLERTDRAPRRYAAI